MTTQNNSSVKPKVVEVESMDEILGTSASVTISGDGSKPTFFKKDESDISFLDKPGDAENAETDNDDDNTPEVNTDEEVINEKQVEEKEPTILKEELDEILSTPGSENEDDEYEDSIKNKGGRKPALIETINKLVDNNSIELFEDEQDLTKYTNDDIVDLIEANIKKKVAETAKNAPLDVFKRLDPKIQDLIAFQLNGGQDVTSILKAAAQSQEVTELSLDNEDHQERIVREWLRASNVMNDEEIEDEISSIIDRGDLTKKAEIFKPKLDDKQSSIMKQKLDEQEKAKERAEEAKTKWSQTIFNSLNKPNLNGIPLSNKVQTMLFHGLTDSSNYQDRNGNPTNALGHFIEEYQHGENANPSILLEALWMMSNPMEYRQHVLSLGQKETHSETFRKLKTAEGERKTSSPKQGETSGTPDRGQGVKRTNSRRQIFHR
mgnify:CR=1 FL=1|tara:strand:+ start:106 stop:1410 length:1305 start_codon:yes stop_codon:yes gene_type:complete